MRLVMSALLVPLVLSSCATTGAARKAYARAGTTTVRVHEVIVTSEDGRTQTKDITTTTYQSPAIDVLKAVGGIAKGAK